MLATFLHEIAAYLPAQSLQAVKLFEHTCGGTLIDANKAISLIDAVIDTVSCAAEHQRAAFQAGLPTTTPRDSPVSLTGD